MGKVYIVRPSNHQPGQDSLEPQNALWLQEKTGETLGYLVTSPVVGSGGLGGVAATREDAEKLIPVFNERYSWVEYKIDPRDVNGDVVCEPYTHPERDVQS